MVTAPTPMQPNPTELANWQVGRNNLNQTYGASMAKSQYLRNMANQGYATQQRTMDYNQGQQRQGFDDPYIGRGMFNSGVRAQGLTNMYTQNQMQRGEAEQQYLNQIGGYNLEDTLAAQQRDTGLGNIDMQEQARRQALAAEIRGVV
jgi:hypothetical protein